MTQLVARPAGVKKNWKQILFAKPMLICILMGFSSGLPLYVLIQLVPAWLRSNEVDLATIGLFSLVGLPYTWKFLWSPLMDRYSFGKLGRRRGWMVLTQILLLVSVGFLGFLDPAFSLRNIVWLVVAIAIFSASQDIVLDAYRRELLPDAELGTGTSLFVNAYKLASLVPGSLALVLSDFIPWNQVFAITGLFMLVGIVTTVWVPEVSDEASAPQSMRKAVIEPFREFFQRDGLRPALAILVFMFLYKLGDSMATALQTPFYLDLGFSRSEVGTIAKLAALWSATAGTAIGGLLMLKISINRALWLFGIVQIVSILGFALLAEVGNNPWMLFAAVSFEYLGVGLGAVALVAFMAKQSALGFTATQFALFSSLTALPRTLAGATTGYLIEWIGYTQFFLLCTLLAVPGMVMLLWVAPWNGSPDREPQPQEAG